MLRTHKKIGLYGEKKIKFLTAFDQIMCLKQNKSHRLLLTHAPISELPSDISTMAALLVKIPRFEFSPSTRIQIIPKDYIAIDLFEIILIVSDPDPVFFQRECWIRIRCCIVSTSVRYVWGRGWCSGSVCWEKFVAESFVVVVYSRTNRESKQIWIFFLLNIAYIASIHNQRGILWK